MPFDLYDFDNKPISFDDLDNKAFWCAHGERQEEAFIKTFTKLQETQLISSTEVLGIHPEKQQNAFHPDLIVNNCDVGEVKTKNSPLFMANTYGVPPQFALTMDLKDSFNYLRLLNQGIDVTIYIWVKWEAKKMVTPKNTYEVAQLAGIWKTKFSALRDLELSAPPPIHWYKEKFRQPPEYSKEEVTHNAWVQELLAFEPRLLNPSKSKVKNITSNGYYLNNGALYTRGHSSCSYVFNLAKQPFKELYSNINRNT